jgi:L-ascorbate metabolism protein UlaG (beta-lactamase superfamily)
MLLTIAIFFVLAGVYLYLSALPKLGERSILFLKKGTEKSVNYSTGKFQNRIPTPMAAPKLSTIIKFFSNNEEQVPPKKLVTKVFSKIKFENSSDFAFCWFGHSTVLIKIDQKTILIDPVFGKRASLFTFLGPKQFDFTNSHSLSDLPQIDVVLISHDHFDHLEFETILALKNNVKHFFVPLGVGAHLAKWGVSKNKITEMDWWEENDFMQEIKFVFTPTRHFSGRSILVRNQTLWGSWTIIGKTQRVFFSGDSGYLDVFKNIGEKYGPFDLAFVENGQYNKDWASIHMMPEQSAKVGSELRAKSVVPIHWGKFSLSIHSWDEPIFRFVKAAENYNYTVLSPAPGEVVVLHDASSFEWWKN